MKAEDFLKIKNIGKPTYEGVRLVDSGMKAYRIVDLLNEYAELVMQQANGTEQGDSNCNIPLVSNRRELLAFCEWYKTTDFNCEGNPPEECVDEYKKANCC